MQQYQQIVHSAHGSLELTKTQTMPCVFGNIPPIVTRLPAYSSGYIFAQKAEWLASCLVENQ